MERNIHRSGNIMQPNVAPLAKHVLVALDESEKSWKAFEFAIGFVKQNTGSDLHVLHVVHRLVMPATGDMAQSAYIVMQREDELVEMGKLLVKKATDHATQMGVESVEALLEVGNPVDVILNIVQKKKVDVVILGNRGMGFRKGALLGSVSERIVANSPATVIVVK